MKKYKYILKNLDCANCARKIEERLEKESYLKHVSVNFSTLKLSFETDDNNAYEKIKKLVKEIEPEVEVLKENEAESKNNHLFRLIIGIFFAFLGFLIKVPYLNTFLIILAYIVLLSRTCKNVAILLVRSKTINENLLITISCVGAYLVGEHMEGLMVIILYEIGKILEEKAINNSRKSISDLMNIKPEYANLEDGTIVTPDEVKINDIIIIKVGEKVPLDGIIIEGSSHLDTSSLTGESKLVSVKSGDQILSGSINTDCILKVKVTKDYENSIVSKILELVENATDKKAKTETFVAKASKIYTPVILGLAIIVAIFSPIFSNLNYFESIYRALIFLVISCPCAIAISVPLSYFSGIGRASKDGILIKGSDYLDSLKDVSEIVFDKTGTLTTGEFGVTKIISFEESYSNDEILKMACLGESFSTHPIAKSILNSYDKKLDTGSVLNYEEIAGKGISYEIDNQIIKIGNADFVNYNDEIEEGTNIFVSINNKVVGVIILNDILKVDTKEAINLLKEKGIKTKMFTGDNQKQAFKIGEYLGIDEIKYEMLPDDKYHELEKMLNKKDNFKIAFVGDGINDSPVLALSDIGISMGGIGSSAAIEASDVVIMTDSLLKIDRAISISKVTNHIIKQNLIFAIATKIIILILSIFGIAGMWQAIFADVGVTLLTILNTLRILKK